MSLQIPDSKHVTPDHAIHDLLKARWSPYVFADRPVSSDDLRSLFEAARWAASSYNEQPWRFIVARRHDEPQRFQRIVDCLADGNQPWAHRVPVLVVGLIATHFAKNGKPNKAAPHDLGAAAAQLTLEATSRGLAVHQMIGIDPDCTKTIFDLPDGYQVFTAIAIGYPGKPLADDMPEKIAERDQAQRSRRPLAEFVFGDWEKPAEFLA